MARRGASGGDGAMLHGHRYRSCVWMSGCRTCTSVDASEWVRIQASAADPRRQPRRRAKDRAGQAWDGTGAGRLEELFEQLFALHDLSGNGLLEEAELIGLNEKIAILHYGEDIDITEVQAKYTAVFRSKLDPNGMPVTYETFRAYAREVVDGLDRDPEAQEMILEQFVAEAQSGRAAFDVPGLMKESDSCLRPTAPEAPAPRKGPDFIEARHELAVLAVDDAQLEAPHWRRITDAPAGVTWL